ncbi:hypothetical protein PtA15_18A347 [Puccinia triticina]|uniref:Uncharacterized protein n=1 Tax=Puccinia triticina TaxID=208348 RepID=A0ABY7DAD5_9BASI|nr:uncharacterized protein PtA15_18A347 [Puccinia triticina]WAQ93287.1 hypothetical protein PtA15_18A347 [Puccinia triticina]
MFLGPQFPRWWRHILLNPSSTHSPHQKSMYKSTTDPLKTPPPHISTVTSITIPAPAVTLVRLLVTKNAKPCWGMLLCLDDDTKASTWWLKVLLPTDQEMKLLSKVFGIHPLTTKDILMEETRKKIELFRNYYLVCFCLFDKDPYSPMYLKPLNIYIILFRKGTLLPIYSQMLNQSGQEDSNSQVLPNLFVKILSSYSVLEVPTGSEIKLEKLATVSKRISVGAASWRLRS